MIAPEPLLTLREAAQYLACAEETVKRLVRRGKLPAARAGRQLRFRPGDLAAYLVASVPVVASQGAGTAAAAPQGGDGCASPRLASLQALLAELAGTTEGALAAEQVLAYGVRALQATSGVVGRCTEDGRSVEIVASSGFDPGILERRTRLALDAWLPLLHVARGGAALFFVGPEQLIARYPRLTTALTRRGAWVFAPLVVGERTIGGLALSFAAPRLFTCDDETLVAIVAQACAQAFERARLYTIEAERWSAAEERARLLGELSQALTAVPDLGAVVSQVLRQLGARFADTVALHLLAEDGQASDTIGIFHRDPEAQGMLEALGAAPPARDLGPMGRVISTGEPLALPVVASGQVEGWYGPAVQDFLARFPVASLLIAPLRARGRTLGALAVARGNPERRFTADDLRLLVDLADRAALALDNVQLYASLQGARAAAEVAVRAREQFLSIAAHELKTPLTPLLGQAQLVERRTRSSGELTDRDRRALLVIARQAQRLDQLVSNMLDLNRLQMGRLTLLWAPVDLGDLARRIAEEVAPTLTQHRLELSLPARPAVVYGDQLRLEQVLQNLIQNAVRYSPAGGSVAVRVALRGDMAVLEVQDWGIGIPAEALPRLFEPFFRAGNAEQRVLAGMGVGLAVVREIMTLHGGTAAASSVDGQGSTFTITLPQYQPGRAAQPAEREAGA